MIAATAGKVPAQRTRRHETGTDFDAFARRILRAYGRRVGDGDIEALRPMAKLAAELDAAMREAVAGLRSDRYGYSWQDIADRLGITRQAAQQRFRDVVTGTDRLDQRLIDGGLTVPVAVLVQVFADHHPGCPALPVCPECGYRYPTGQLDCPTNQMVRPLLYRRRAEDKAAVARLTPIQLADLHHPDRAARRAAVARTSVPDPTTSHQPTLLSLLHGEDSSS